MIVLTILGGGFAVLFVLAGLFSIYESFKERRARQEMVFKKLNDLDFRLMDIERILKLEVEK